MVSASDLQPNVWDTKTRENGLEFSLERGKKIQKKTRFADEQIVFASNQVESGSPFEEVCRKVGVSLKVFYRWKKKFGDVFITELRNWKYVDRPKKSTSIILLKSFLQSG
ncbi:transposase [Pirellulaceae bacterium]|jgi:putative transposase|nr:transposase [Pirellulaceae bacterium]MDB4640938.1 transposase [Pirellulaceae bacterium]